MVVLILEYALHIFSQWRAISIFRHGRNINIFDYMKAISIFPPQELEKPLKAFKSLWKPLRNVWEVCFGTFGDYVLVWKEFNWSQAWLKYLCKGGQETHNYSMKKKIEKSYHLLTLKDLVALVITTGCPRLQISWNKSTAAEVSVLPSRRKTQPLSSQEWGTVQYWFLVSTKE